MAVLNKGDRVCFLHYDKLNTGTIERIGDNDLICIDSDCGEILYARSKYVVHIERPFCIVNKDPTYSYKPMLRFDFTTYKSRNKTWEHWTNPASWIHEFFDPYELRDKATVYGLEI